MANSTDYHLNLYKWSFLSFQRSRRVNGDANHDVTVGSSTQNTQYLPCATPSDPIAFSSNLYFAHVEVMYVYGIVIVNLT